MYVQAMASLAHIRQITCVACPLADSPFIVGWGTVVCGWFIQVGYCAAAFIRYPDVCVTEYVCEYSVTQTYSDDAPSNKLKIDMQCIQL